MAWQVPKTDWAASDGVRDTDFNRIEENILELYNTESLKSTLLVYVATTGNDTTGNGTAAAPFKTITKALSVIPKNLAGKNASITIGAGTYPEAVTVSGFSGGSLTLTGVTNAAITINSLSIIGCMCNITSIKFITSSAVGVTVSNSAALISTGDFTCTGSSVGIKVTGCSRAHVVGTVNITNAKTAVEVINCSSAFISSIDGSNVTTGMYVSAASTLAYDYADIAVKSALMYTVSGGRIYTGAQANAPTA